CLRAGDELTIGNHRYQVQWNVPLAEPAAQPRAAVPGKEAVRRTRADPFEDDAQLESCEEPVALAEPREGKAPVLPSAPANPPGKQAVGQGPAPVRNQPSAVLPDDLELAPLSEPPPPPAEPGDPPG